MTAATADRHTPRRDGKFYSRPVKGSTQIFAGTLVALDASGFAIPGATATTLTADGRAEENVNNTGADGDVSIEVRKGVFQFNNSAGADEITAAEIGDNCYIVDDQTVAKTDDSSSRSVAGPIVDVDADGVWVRFD